MRTEEEIIKDIVDWFKNNEDVFNECIEELDSYDGYLGDDRYEDMCMLDEIFACHKPSEILEMAFFGWDEDDWWVDERGEKHHKEFNPNRPYFRFNGYGNLVSCYWKDYSDHIDHWAVEKMAENRRWVTTIDDNGNEELAKLFDEYEDPEAFEESEERKTSEEFIDTMPTGIGRVFECNMDDSYVAKDSCDEWGTAFIWDEKQGIGAEYNYCIDDGENCSAIYLMRKENDDGDWDTDTSEYKHYEINWDSITWKCDLAMAMSGFLDEYINWVKHGKE